MHARLAQTVRSCMNSTCVVTLLKAGQTEMVIFGVTTEEEGSS